MHEPKLIGGRRAARAHGPPGGEGRPRRRIGIPSFSSPGHYYPLTALGRRLQSRGHEVVYFQVADLERPIRAAGLIEAAFGTGRRAVPYAVGRSAR
jgi:hypothetical protein